MVPGGGLQDADAEEAKLAAEELQLESDIRALEMEISIMDMKRQIEVQEEHLQNWQQMLAKNNAGRLQCEKLKWAQEELAHLRAKCAAIEAKRPPRMPSPARAISAEKKSPDGDARPELDVPADSAGKEAKVPPRSGSTTDAPAAAKRRGYERSSARGENSRAAAAAAAAVVARGQRSGPRGGYEAARSISHR